MCRAAPRWRDGLTDLAVIFYGETKPATRLSLTRSLTSGLRVILPQPDGENLSMQSK
jgi:hypothetical protein